MWEVGDRTVSTHMSKPIISPFLSSLTQIDIDEYPQTYEMQKRCVNMLARLWNAPLGEEEGTCGMLALIDRSIDGGDGRMDSCDE